MKELAQMIQLLRCPSCSVGKLGITDLEAVLTCKSCSTQYPLSSGRPVLLRPDNELFSQNDYVEITSTPGQIARERNWKGLVPTPSLNLARNNVLKKLRSVLDEVPAASVLVVGGGNQKDGLDQSLGSSRSVCILYSDIDIGADVDLFCDGHDLPFADCSFDAVVTTAVLEHVLYPERVASEIVRVLKGDGLLYSELPFIQQVHEGAYDFTRYTLSGHRRLFNSITEIESGMVAGPGTAMVWSIENLALAFVSRPAMRGLVKTLVRLLFAWIKFFDLLLQDKPAAMDGASCTYLYGKKVMAKISDVEIVARYVGGQTLRHT